MSKFSVERIDTCAQEGLDLTKMMKVQHNEHHFNVVNAIDAYKALAGAEDLQAFLQEQRKVTLGEVFGAPEGSEFALIESKEVTYEGSPLCLLVRQEGDYLVLTGGTTSYIEECIEAEEADFDGIRIPNDEVQEVFDAIMDL